MNRTCMDIQEYREEINTIFRRYTRKGFVDYRDCSWLASEIVNLLDNATKDLSRHGMYIDLFDTSCKAFVKWDNVEKNDSNGETQYFCEFVKNAWDVVYNAESKDISHAKMLDWFMKKLDGSEMEYMEDVILEFMATHFSSPELMQIKLQFYNAQIANAEGKLTDPETEHKSYYEFLITRYREYILRLKADIGCPIEEIREYSESFKSYSVKRIMADIEKRYGNIDRVIELYRELADAEDAQGYSRCEWRVKLKDLFKEIGDKENYERELKTALSVNVGNLELWQEYKSLFTTEEWPNNCKAYFDSMDPSALNPLPWYAEENRFDLIMNTIERSNSAVMFKYYEKKLRKLYPERCLNILISDARDQAVKATKRNEYRHIAETLSRIEWYDDGDEIAHQLAEEFRIKYPRRTAMCDELTGF